MLESPHKAWNAVTAACRRHRFSCEDWKKYRYGAGRPALVIRIEFQNAAMNSKPIFDADTITGAELLENIQRHGAVLIRGGLDKAEIAAMLARAEQAYTRWSGRYARGELNAVERTAFEVGHVSPDDLRQETESFAVVAFFVRSPLSRLLATLWDGNLLFLSDNCVPRRQLSGGGEASRPVPFHQDASFLGNAGLVLNFWIPLVACGRDAPGLEVVMEHPQGSIDRDSAVNQPSLPDYSGIDIPDEEVMRRFGADKLWHPEMEPGDVLVFSNLTVHRTYMHAGMSRDRISLEVRCTDGASGGRWARGDLLPVQFKAKA